MEPKTKKLVTVFVILGAVLVLLAMIGTGFLIYYGMKTFEETPLADVDFERAISGASSLISGSQSDALESWGIDPVALENSITQEQIECLINSVGQSRAEEIYNGAEPTMAEVLSALPCLE